MPRQLPALARKAGCAAGAGPRPSQRTRTPLSPSTHPYTVTEHVLVLAAAIFVVALLYSSVGHAGASGYIAVMSLFGLGIEVIRPTALALNILVAAIGFIQWWRGGHFVWALFWPFALLSVPAAFLGGPCIGGHSGLKWDSPVCR